MSNKDPMKALQAYLALKKRADAGDDKAKIELAKVTANPRAMLTLKHLAGQARAMVTALTAAHVIDTRADEAADDVLGAAEEADERISGGDELERADYLAQSLPPGSDTLDHKALLRRDKWKNLRGVAPFTRDTPPSALSSYMGGQATVLSAPTAEQDTPVEVAHWAGEDEESRAITVTVGPVDTSTAFDQFAGNAAVRAFGRILFGTKNILLPLEFDIGPLGRQFTVTCSQIRVLIGAEDFGNTQYQINVTGMISFRATEKSWPLYRTKYSSTINGGASEVINVPTFATNVTPFRTDNTVQITLEFIDTRGNTRYTIVVAAGAQQLTPIPLAGDITRVKITNNSVATAIFAELIFGLSA